MESGTLAKLPLEGVRIVDLTTVVMGPLATRMLADMGADVIWVESPEGDVLREYEPMRNPRMGAFSMSVSRNKRSIVKQKATSAWLSFCEENSIPASDVVDLENLGDHPHFAAVGLYQEDEHPTEGPYRYVRDPIRLNGKSNPIRHHAPQLGADTEEVLRELGWDEERIAEIMPGDTR